MIRKRILAGFALALVPLWIIGCSTPTQPPKATPAVSIDVPLWKLRSSHFVYGMPLPTDARHQIVVDGVTQPGISVLVKEGFVVGHYDRFKVPAWVSMLWTVEDYQRSRQEPYDARNWAEDEELPRYAVGGTSYDFQQSRMTRGHMARHLDSKAWAAGCSQRCIV